MFLSVDAALILLRVKLLQLVSYGKTLSSLLINDLGLVSKIIDIIIDASYGKSRLIPKRPTQVNVCVASPSIITIASMNLSGVF